MKRAGVTSSGTAGDHHVLVVLGALTGAIDLEKDAGRRRVLAVLAAAGLEEDRLETYTHLIRAAAKSAVARTALEVLMSTVFKDDFIDRIKAEGRAEGEARGRAEGEAGMLLRILAARGFEVPGPVRDRVLSCTDLGQLEDWAAQAVSAATLDDVLTG